MSAAKEPKVNPILVEVVAHMDKFCADHEEIVSTRDGRRMSYHPPTDGGWKLERGIL